MTADGSVFDMFSGFGASFGIIVPIILIMGVLAVIVFILYIKGVFDKLLKRYQTTALCFEDRRDKLSITGVDKLNAEMADGKLTYHFKERKQMRINVPPLSLIDLVKGKNVVLMYIAGRLEAHPMEITKFTAHTLQEDAYFAYKAANTGKEPETKADVETAFSMVDTKGIMLKRALQLWYEDHDEAPKNKEELERAIAMQDKKERFQFLPKVNEGHINLLAEQIAADKATYATQWEKIKELMPIIGPVIFAFVLGIGLFLTFGKIDELIMHLGQISTGVAAAAASGASVVKDVIPVEMP